MSAELICFQVAILAGGKGTRLKGRTGNLPKPMAPILGRPVLEHQIELCRRYGFKRIALLVHYEHEAISNYFGDGSNFGVELVYRVEQDARGTAGALRDALGIMDDVFLVLYGDTYVDVNLANLWVNHLASKAVATLLLHPNDHPHDSDLVEVNDASRVLAIHPYPHAANQIYANLVNAALYVMERNVLETVISESGKADLAKHTFPAMLNAGMYLHAYITPEYIKDMGTPDRLDKVERDIVTGLPERLSSRHLRQAVFLDRDGTLNVEVNHLNSPTQLELLPDVADAVRLLNRAGILAIGVTNQPVLARGEATWTVLNRIHAALDNLLGKGNAYLDRMYVCPHHPDRGFQGEIVELKIDCDCRKPRTGMIDRAVRELTIARGKSWMVGDTSSDIRAGKQAGLRTILARTGYAGLDGKYPDEPDYIMPNLPAAVDWILNGHKAMACQLLSVTSSAINSRLVLVAGVSCAGKSCAARVLAEQLETAGKVVHVLSLDGWLYPIEQRPEGKGVLERFNMHAFKSALFPILKSKGRHELEMFTYDRKNRNVQLQPPLSIGPDDIIIVEGVTALVDSELRAFSDVRIFIEIDNEVRVQRLHADYTWRGEPLENVKVRLCSRDKDELPVVRASAKYATHHIFN